MNLKMRISIVFNYLQSMIKQSHGVILFCDLDDSRLFSLFKKGDIYTHKESIITLKY